MNTGDPCKKKRDPRDGDLRYEGQPAVGVADRAGNPRIAKTSEPFVLKSLEEALYEFIAVALRCGNDRTLSVVKLKQLDRRGSSDIGC